MLKHLLIPSLFFLIACGDNIVPDRDRDPEVDPDRGDWELDPGGPCLDFDNIGLCPDAPPPPIDAGVEVAIDACSDEPDASVPELDVETKGACCHALLDGSPPNQECGYPPGLCKNGKKTMFCRLSDGTDAQFTLCNP